MVYSLFNNIYTWSFVVEWSLPKSSSKLIRTSFREILKLIKNKMIRERTNMTENLKKNLRNFEQPFMSNFKFQVLFFGLFCSKKNFFFALQHSFVFQQNFYFITFLFPWISRCKESLPNKTRSNHRIQLVS